MKLKARVDDEVGQLFVSPADSSGTQCGGHGDCLHAKQSVLQKILDARRALEIKTVVVPCLQRPNPESIA